MVRVTSLAVWMLLACLVLLEGQDKREEFIKAKKVALVAGVKDYKDRLTLETCAADATEIGRRLEKQGYRVVLMVSGGSLEPLTKESIENEWKKICEDKEEKEVVLLFFTGHGVMQNEINYLCPSNVEFGNIPETCVSLNDMQKMLESVNAQVKLMIVDACRENLQPRFLGSMGSPKFGNYPALGVGVGPKIRLRKKPRGTGRLFSTSPFMFSYQPLPEDRKEGITHSLFVHYLLEAMKKGDKDGDECLTLDEIYEYVYDQLYKHTEKNPDREQIPYKDWSGVGKGSPVIAVVEKKTEYGLPSEVWKDCKYQQDGEWILDMTTDYWCTLSVDKQQKYAAMYQKAYAIAKGLKLEKTEDEGRANIPMCLIPPGRYWMGSPDGSTIEWKAEDGRYDDEKLHRVILSRPFYISKTEITQAQWKAVIPGSSKYTDSVIKLAPDLKDKEMKSDPSYFKGDQLPVEQVSWYDCQSFCEKIGVKLPTEAQWEYACRSGVITPFNLGKNITPEQVNYDGNYPYAGESKGVYRGRTVPGGSLPNANAWGLYDMHGNVWEWCEDAYGKEIYEKEDIVEPKYQKGSNCVRRGGCWFDGARDCRCAYRGRLSPGCAWYFVGLRVVSPVF